MNPKKEKLQAEKVELIAKIKKNDEKNSQMKARISEIDTILTSILNSEYGAVMRSYDMTPEELAEFLEKTKLKGKDG